MSFNVSDVPICTSMEGEKPPPAASVQQGPHDRAAAPDIEDESLSLCEIFDPTARMHFRKKQRLQPKFKRPEGTAEMKPPPSQTILVAPIHGPYGFVVDDDESLSDGGTSRSTNTGEEDVDSSASDCEDREDWTTEAVKEGEVDPSNILGNKLRITRRSESKKFVWTEKEYEMLELVCDPWVQEADDLVTKQDAESKRRFRCKFGKGDWEWEDAQMQHIQKIEKKEEEAQKHAENNDSDDDARGTVKNDDARGTVKNDDARGTVEYNGHYKSATDRMLRQRMQDQLAQTLGRPIFHGIQPNTPPQSTDQGAILRMPSLNDNAQKEGTKRRILAYPNEHVKIPTRRGSGKLQRCIKDDMRGIIKNRPGRCGAQCGFLNVDKFDQRFIKVWKTTMCRSKKTCKHDVRDAETRANAALKPSFSLITIEKEEKASESEPPCTGDANYSAQTQEYEACTKDRTCNCPSVMFHKTSCGLHCAYTVKGRKLSKIRTLAHLEHHLRIKDCNKQKVVPSFKPALLKVTGDTVDEISPMFFSAFDKNPPEDIESVVHRMGISELKGAMEQTNETLKTISKQLTRIEEGIKDHRRHQMGQVDGMKEFANLCKYWSQHYQYKQRVLKKAIDDMSQTHDHQGK